MLETVALIILILVAIILFYGIIVIHDIPYEIAVHRNHPHQDAIHYAGWVSLFTLHVLWPFLWIWATLWREDRGWGIQQIQTDQRDLHAQVDALSAQVAELKSDLQSLKGSEQTSQDTSVANQESAEDGGKE